ncbi:32838_t:CDS:2 [Racocetra persica]|uniref:32838_t:CDS:1 n=1 Tax=Racocetra persica TaxID=160502 RepID=A0ACA9MXN7_9GLOM|nr:32838_t:CDS:2 [Racocetra persica]
MEPKNYATIRSLLKKERGEKVAPHEINEETEFTQEDQELEKAYKEISQDKERKKLTKLAQKAALKDLQKRL